MPNATHALHAVINSFPLIEADYVFSLNIGYGSGAPPDLCAHSAFFILLHDSSGETRPRKVATFYSQGSQ